MNHLDVKRGSVATHGGAGRGARRDLLTPFGQLRIVAESEGVTSVWWVEPTAENKPPGSTAEDVGAGESGVLARRGGADRDKMSATTAAADLDVDAQALSEHWADQAVTELVEYFQGRRKSFSVPVTLRGTPFQTAVWDALTHIPYGQIKSYRDVATAIGNARAVRAVGQANRANPVPIIVPCHRVIGANGALVGYAGTQVDLKARLLDLERAWK